jgi:glycine cleavage system aminomethyltransferase T
VTDLGFLSLDAASEDVLARSPMEQRLREAGATFAKRDGWLVATHVPREEARELVVRDVTAFHRVHEGSDGVLVEFRSGALDDPLVVGFLWSGEDRPPERRTDVSAGYAALQIAGRGATSVLRRLTELELDDLPTVGALAHVRAIVIRDEEESYRLVFEQEYGHYLWEVVVDAAEPLGGGPAGMRGSTPSSAPPTSERRSAA